MHGDNVTIANCHLCVLATGPISIAQPIIGYLGQAASIFCQLDRGNTADIFLRLNGMMVTDTRFFTGFTNATHREFIFNPVMMSDDGAFFKCSIAGIDSSRVTFSITCKLTT